MNEEIVNQVLSRLTYIENECRTIRKILGCSEVVVLTLTFREFVRKVIKDDRRIRNQAFFCGMVDGDPGEFHHWWPEAIRDYKCLGDVPMWRLLNVGEIGLLKIRRLGRKSLLAFKDIVGDYGLMLGVDYPNPNEGQ